MILTWLSFQAEFIPLSLCPMVIFLIYNGSPRKQSIRWPGQKVDQLAVVLGRTYLANVDHVVDHENVHVAALEGILSGLRFLQRNVQDILQCAIDADGYLSYLR